MVPVLDCGVTSYRSDGWWPLHAQDHLYYLRRLHTTSTTPTTPMLVSPSTLGPAMALSSPSTLGPSTSGTPKYRRGLRRRGFKRGSGDGSGEGSGEGVGEPPNDVVCERREGEASGDDCVDPICILARPHQNHRHYPGRQTRDLHPPLSAGHRLHQQGNECHTTEPTEVQKSMRLPSVYISKLAGNIIYSYRFFLRGVKVHSCRNVISTVGEAPG